MSKVFQSITRCTFSGHSRNTTMWWQTWLCLGLSKWLDVRGPAATRSISLLIRTGCHNLRLGIIALNLVLSTTLFEARVTQLSFVSLTNWIQPHNAVSAIYDTLNMNKKESNYRTFPENQISVCLWPVSQYTQVEEEVLVYPFQSFLAEFGGALGLFLGFSFMTIWDGVMGMMISVMELKKNFQ